MFETLRNLLFGPRRAPARATGAAPTQQGLSGPPPDDVVRRLFVGAQEATALGNHKAAVDSLLKAIELKHDFAEAHFLLGAIYENQGHNEDAADCYVMAVYFDPCFASGHFRLGLLAQQKNDHDQALRHFEKALACKPDDVDARFNVGKILLERGEYAAACTHYRKVIESCPQHATAHNNLAYALLKGFSRASDALRCVDEALRLAPGLADAHCNRGMVLQFLGRCEEAIAASNRALVLDPRLDEARLNRALAMLMLGDYSRGWHEYEIRKNLYPGFKIRSFPYPEWSGGPLSGKTVLVYAEQGLGDEIMFASCVPDLVRRAGHCVIESHLKLEKLYARSFPSATVIGGDQAVRDTSWLKHAPAIDCVVAIGTLPLHFRNSQNDFPRHTGYLKADPARVAHWRARLASLGEGVKAGISWRGGTQHSNQVYRSLALEELLPLLRVPGVQFVSLQYTESSAEIAALHDRHGLSVEHWQEAIENYDETAALVGALDLVISVQTAVVHLAGALGRPAWVLVPANPEWRYLAAGQTLPWYPSVRLFRQARLGEWQPVVERISAELARLVAARHGPD